MKAPARADEVEVLPVPMGNAPSALDEGVEQLLVLGLKLHARL
jgi:hypothetical protein